MNTHAKKKLRWGTLLAVAVLSAILPLTAAGDNGDPPGRVARIRYVQGSVSFDPAGESDWVPAVTNRPMTIGDQIWADASSRAEIQVGSAMIRMDQNTGFSFLNLDDRTVQIQLTDGTLDLRVHRLRTGEVFEVDTPNQAFTVTQPGLYRLQVRAEGTSSMVIVRQGHGQVTGGGRSYELNAGQGGTFTGTGTDTFDGQFVAVGDPDEFDNWGSSRDRQYDGSRSARYVSPDVVGYEDLDANGTWSTDPTYGNVWMPTSVQSGWAPYRNGHWVWVSPWGWTWVDDAPWGYAPFHYGRWVSLRGRWGWVPGPVNAQPVYAPALVAFIGGANFGVSISAGGGGGNVGWFPLGPREVYVPSYAASRGYLERVNTSNTTVNTTTITNVYNNQVTNNTTITNVTYVNRTVPGAVTAVPQNAFRSSAPVARAAVQMNEKQMTAAPVVSRAAVAPTRESVLGTSASGATRMARPPDAVLNRPVVAKTTPPPPPVPFAKQQQELAKHPGQPLAPHEVQALRPATASAVPAHPQVKQAPPAKPATLKASHPANQPTVGNAKQPANAPPPNQLANKPGNPPVANAPGNQPPVRSDRPPSAQQQQAAQQQAAQQQAAEKARQQQAQQQAAQQQAAEKARQQQAQQQAAQQAAQQQHRPPSAQPAPSQQTAQQQQQADKARRQQAAQQQAAQQQAAQQQAADKARQQQAQQQAAQQAAQQQHRPPSAQPAPSQQTAQQQQQEAQQQAAEKARQQQAAQQQAAQQQAAEKARQQQAQQQAAQPQPNRPPSAQPAPSQQAAQQQAAQQQARQQQAAQQQAAQQQQAERERQQQANQQTAQHRPPSVQPAPQPKAQPAPPPQATPNRSPTPAEKAKEDQKKGEQKPPPPQ